MLATPAELAARTEVVLTALPTEETVRQVYDEMSAVGLGGQLYADHSTVSPGLEPALRGESSRSTARSSSTHRCRAAPPEPRLATLTVMVGGDEATFNRALPVFEAFGGKIRLCGGVGAGQVIKLVNQYLVAVHTLAASEAAAFAVQLGAGSRHGPGRDRHLVRKLGDAAAQSARASSLATSARQPRWG